MISVNFGQAALISVDFVGGGSGGNPSSLPPSGDTTLAAGLAQNTDGLIFTGQTGAWNALDVTPYGNANYGAVSTGLLSDGSGASTTVTLTVGSHRGNWPYEDGNLRHEAASTWYSGPVSLELAGLNPGTEYDLAVFGVEGNLHIWNNPSSPYPEMIANGVTAIYDSEGDFNWASLTADVDGKILATLPVVPGGGNLEGGSITGLQLAEVASGVPEPSTFVLLALGLLGLGWFKWRRRG